MPCKMHTNKAYPKAPIPDPFFSDSETPKPTWFPSFSTLNCSQLPASNLVSNTVLEGLELDSTSSAADRTSKARDYKDKMGQLD